MICKYQICNNIYSESVYDFLNNYYWNEHFYGDFLPYDEILNILLKEPLISYYKIENLICNIDILENLLYPLPLDDLIPTIDILDNAIDNRFFMLGNHDELYNILNNALDNSIHEYLDNVDIADFTSTHVIFDVVDKFSDFDSEDGFTFDEYRAQNELESKIKDNINEELQSKLNNMSYNLYGKHFYKLDDVSKYSSDIKQLLKDQRDSYTFSQNEDSNHSNTTDLCLIDCMFESF